ncbi:MAG: hypothetical protein H0T62_14605 [Parachlamydiaceae bacterium]|nr:hypothetical protein [Parachlamydiaceae bacterium]
MGPYTVALFGEAEKGEYHTAYYCNNLEQLADNFGNAPLHSMGLYYAIQAVLYHRDILFFRVREEGFSIQDYYYGVKLLETQRSFPNISAICMPGVGNSKIIEAAAPLCAVHHSLLIISEADLYDYLTLRAA